MLGCLDYSIVAPSYEALGKDKARGGVQDLFRKYYGDRAPFIEYLFCQLRDRYPVYGAERDKYESKAFWAETQKELIEKYKPKHEHNRSDDFKRLAHYYGGMFLEAYDRVRKNHPLFRFELTEPVHADVLNEAVEKTLAFFPWMRYAVVVDTEWSHYTRENRVFFAENDLPIVIRESSRPVRPNTEAANYHAFSVVYQDRVIQFAFSHTISDGKGMLCFAEAVMYRYLSALYGRREAPGVLTGSSESDPKFNYDNIPFDYSLLDPSYSFAHCSFPSLKIQTSDDEFIETGEHAEVKTDSAAFVAFSKSRGTTPAIAAFLLLAEMVQRLFPENDKHISADIRKTACRTASVRRGSASRDRI